MTSIWLPQFMLALALALPTARAAPSPVATEERVFTDAQGRIIVPQRPGEMIRIVLEAGDEDHLKETYQNYRARLEDLQQLAAFALNFPNLDEFLTQLSLLSNIEAEDDKPAAKDTEQIKLSTIHWA